ncbi:Ff.00g077540.m01.CDS01 [Fusarium sp. VM40]|nr:Ff.00g077540.m01.CDS01 [Fusarium sp. VM40]
MTMETWEAFVATHREKQEQAIPESWKLSQKKLDQISGAGTPQEGHLIELKAAQASGLLSQREMEITESFTARELLTKMRSQSLRAQDVVVAFCKRAAIAQQLTSCLTEILFDKAVERARFLDAQLTATGKVIGPLHGLPISLKDSFHVEGYHSTVGYVEFLKRPLPQGNAALVKLLEDAGAILYCKTNVSQTMMTADSENNIFGRTLNPHNTRLTAGGSTGGEGALVAFRGSILGVGTDLAGSVRIPALCCGIYGFKPTVDRIPFEGQALSPFPVQWISSVMPAAGPLATSVDDLSLFMEVVTGLQPWKYDSSAVFIPWRSLDSEHKALIIGILPEDEEYLLHPPVRRILAKAIHTLEKAGHKLVRLPADPHRSVSLGARIGYQFFGIASPDPAVIAQSMGEPFVASVAKGMHPFSGGDFPVSPKLDIPTQFHKLNEARGAYGEAWKEAWREYELDVVIAPGAVGTAVPHDTYGLPVYTVMWNVLDYPAAVIPFGYASASEDPEPQTSNMAFVPDYDAKSNHGAPGSIQIISPRFRDEECLEAARIIDKALRSI